MNSLIKKIINPIQLIKAYRFHKNQKKHVKSSQDLELKLYSKIIKTDMLHESFWSSVKRNPSTAFLALISLVYGKAALKDRLSATSDVDVTILPYNRSVIKYIEEHRLEGGKSILITGSSQIYADKVSEYLKLFDGAYGTRDGSNLTGKAKRDFIHDFLG